MLILCETHAQVRKERDNAVKASESAYEASELEGEKICEVCGNLSMVDSIHFSGTALLLSCDFSSSATVECESYVVASKHYG